MDNKQNFIKKLIPIFMSTFVAWFHAMAMTPLGYIYGSFPGQDALVMSIATIPGIVAMLSGFASAALISFMGRKPLIISSMFLSLTGGLIVRFLGDTNVYIAIVGSAMTGFAAGAIPAANVSALADITPANLSDKIFGINDAITNVGLVVSNALAGILAASGNWVKAWDVFGLVAIALVATFIWYPAEEKRVGTEDAKAGTSSKSKIPGSIIVLIMYKCVIALFYMALSLNLSALIINELQIGTSVHVGALNSIAALVGAVSMVFVFLVLKAFKRLSITATVLLTAIGFLTAVASKSVVLIGIAFCVASFGINAQTSSITTTIGNATKGKAAGIASGLLQGSTFLGEAMCGYVPSIAAGIVLGSTAPSDCIKVSAYALIILAVIGYFIYRKTYSISFQDPEKAPE